MSFNVTSLPFFDKQLKRLAKKYPSLKSEFIDLIATLSINPEAGTAIGEHCYKIRLAIASKGKGKSGGARIITYVQVTNNSVYLISIYDKSEQENISAAELKQLIDSVPE